MLCYLQSNIRNSLVYIIYWIACFVDSSYYPLIACAGLIMNHYTEDDKITKRLKAGAFYTLVSHYFFFSFFDEFPDSLVSLEGGISNIFISIMAFILTILGLLIPIASICSWIIMAIFTTTIFQKRS